MEASWPSPSELTSSGSGAGPEPWDAPKDVATSYMLGVGDDEEDDLDRELTYHSRVDSHAFAAGGLAPGEYFNAKVAPAFDGRGQWFVFEEMVQDWQDITTIEESKRGAHLRNRLSGEAVVYRSTLDREKLADKDTGVQYFMETIRPHFLKGVQSVFLYRLFQFMKLRRGKLEINRWLAKYSLMRKRLMDAWTDLFTPMDPSTPPSGRMEDLRRLCRTRQLTLSDLSEQQQRDLLNESDKEEHQEQFPFKDNLYTLIFLIQSDLSDQQRLLLMSQLSIRKLKMQDWTWEIIRDLFMELLSAPKSNFDDPNVRPRNDFRERSFFLLEEESGFIDGHSGYWVEEEETGLVGFLDEFADEFWVMNEDSTWAIRRFKGRKFKKGKGRGGKGRGSKGRSRFRKRGKGKGYSADAEPWAQEEAYKGGKGKGKFKGGKKGKKSSPFEKGKKPKGKGKAHESEAASESPPASATQGESYDQGSSDQHTDASGWQGEQYSDQDWANWTEEEWQPGGWHDPQQQSWCASSWQQCFLENVVSFDRPACCFDVWDNHSDDIFKLDPVAAWHTAKPINLKMQPTYVIMDLGCTRSMGSMLAVQAFEWAAYDYGIWCTWERCHTVMSFADSKTEVLNWCVKIHFPTDPPVTTTVDVHESGNIPILLSFPQMIRLGFDFKLRPWACTVSSEALGFKDEPLEFSNTRHAVLDMSRITGSFKKMDSSSKASLRQAEPISFAAQEHSSVLTYEPSGKTLVPESDSSGPVSVIDQSVLVVTTGTDSNCCNAFSAQIKSPETVLTAGERWCDAEDGEEEGADDDCLGTRLSRKTSPQELEERTRLHKAVGPRPGQTVIPKWRVERAGAPPPKWNAAGPPPKKAGAKVKPGGPPPKAVAKPKRQKGNIEDIVPGAQPTGGRADNRVPEGKAREIRFPKLDSRVGESGPRVNSGPVLGDEAAPPALPNSVVPDGSAPEDQLDSDKELKKSLAKIHAKLSCKVELLKLHLKHYHMSLENFKRRTSQLQLPKKVYEDYADVVRACEACTKHAPAPERSRVTGMRATTPGDLVFVDHVDLSIDNMVYCVLVCIDAASNLIWAGAQNNKEHAETRSTMQRCFDEWHLRPRALCGDSYFMEADFKEWYAFHGIKPIELGPHTPWPNRAEAAVKLFKHYAQILIDSIREYAEVEPAIRRVTVRQILSRAVWARNVSLTYGGKCPLEIFSGQRPPDIIDPENSLPEQLTASLPSDARLDLVLKDLAQKAHTEARQSLDIRRDLAVRLRHSEGPFRAGQSVWYWQRDMSKLRDGKWIRSRVVGDNKPPMVNIELNGTVVRVNESKLKLNPDPWHDVVIPGLDNRDTVTTVPGTPPKTPGSAPATPLGEFPAPATPDLLEPHLRVGFPPMSSSGVMSVGSPELWLPKPDESSYFMQICCHSDKLSSWADAYLGAPEPIVLSGPGFTHSDRTGMNRGFQRLRTCNPYVLWVSLCTGDTLSKDTIALEFCYKAIVGQYNQNRRFVFAYPWDGALWQTSSWANMTRWPGVRVLPCNMSSWHPVITSNPGKMCLVVGGPADWCSQLSYGPYPVNKKQSYTEQDWQILMSDAYPDKFCEQALMTLSSGRQCDIHWPVAEPGHVLFVTDLVDVLNDQEVSVFKENIQDLEFLGVSNRSLSVAAATSVKPCLVTDSETKWFMNWLNSRRNGYTGTRDDLGPRQFQAVRKLRTTYFPECSFDHVLVLRGKNATQIQDIQAGENQAVVIMWQKSSQAKFIYASALDAIDFSASENFSLNKWSVVLLYNKGGGPTRNNTIRGPAKEPVDLRSSVHGGGTGGGPSSSGRPGSSSGPLPPRPPSPPGPPTYQPPIYSNPDMVIPPWPGSTLPLMDRPVEPLPMDVDNEIQVPGTPRRDVDNVGPSPSSPSCPSVRRTVDKHRRRAPPKVVRRTDREERVKMETDDNVGAPTSSSSQVPRRVGRGRSPASPDPPYKAPPPSRRERSRSHDSYRDMPGLESEPDSDYNPRERSRSRDGPQHDDRYFRERSRSRDNSPQSHSEDEDGDIPNFRTPEEFLTPTRSEPSSSSRHRINTRSPSRDRPKEEPKEEPIRRTAVKSLPKSRCPPTRDPVEFFQDTEGQPDHASDADSENEYYCGACAVLSMRGDDRCYDCLLLQDSKTHPDLCWWNMKRCSHGQSCVTSCHWQDADTMDDLVVLEDPDHWSSLPDSHKFAAMTGNFGFVRDLYDDVVDISDEYSTPQVSTTLYLDDSWHKAASFEEFMLDVEDRPKNEGLSLIRAHKNKQHTLRVAKTPEQRAAAPKRKGKARSEASAQDKRMYAKQFLEAKHSECKSWLKENDVLDVVDMNKQPVKNFITGRWVLTIKRDKDGQFLKCKARWVLRGFQDRQVWDLQTDSPTSTRPGFRLQCQAAANNEWDLTHIDLKTAFLQGDTFGKDRDIVCQLPPEAGYPPNFGARLKRAAYGLNDAPRLWWNKLDKALRSYGLVPARADRCCYVLYSNKSSLRSRTHVTDSEATKSVTFADEAVDSENEKEASLAGSTSWEATEDVLLPFGSASVATLEAKEVETAMKAVDTKEARHNEKLGKSATTPFDLDGALELLLDPVTGSPAHGRQVEGVVTIHVDDALMAGTPHFRKLVVEGLRRDFQVGSEDLNDILFVGQRIRWIDKGKKTGRIQVDQERKIEELSQIALDSSLREGTLCTPDLHKQYRSVLGQINWLQSRTQFQSCYQFSRCASASAKPTIADCKVLNKLVRTIREQVCVLNFWPLKGTCRLIGYPDAAFRNNEDKTSQRGQTIFLAEPRKSGAESGKGSLVDYESQKIKRTVLSTTVAELYAFMKCFGTCQFLRGLWMDISGSAAEVHMRTDANNLVTTASTTHLPEQKETIHMINQLRTEASSGAIDDLAHVVTGDMLADCLTKHSVKPTNLIRTINTGIIPNVDKHPPFRELMKHRHKAYELAEWCVYNLLAVGDIKTFLLAPLQEEVHHILSVTDWYRH